MILFDKLLFRIVHLLCTTILVYVDALCYIVTPDELVINYNNVGDDSGLFLYLDLVMLS